MIKDRRQRLLKGRFLVFAGEEFYPSGGFDDIVGEDKTFNTWEDAELFARLHLGVEGDSCWAQVWDSRTGDVYQYTTKNDRLPDVCSKCTGKGLLGYNLEDCDRCEGYGVLPPEPDPVVLPPAQTTGDGCRYCGKACFGLICAVCKGER